MAAIRALNWDLLFGGDDGDAVRLCALWPSPVDHDACFQAAGFDEFADSDEDWDAEWLDIVIRAIEYLQRYGPIKIERSAGACREDERPAWWQRLLIWWWQRFGAPPGITFASSLPISEQLVLASQHDQFGPCVVRFGGVVLQTDSGHAILWIKMEDQTSFDPPEIAEACAAGRPVAQRSLDWRHLRGESRVP